MTYSCRAGASKNSGKHFTAREMMFGTPDSFNYVVCGDCESIQIAEIPSPEAMAQHYPDDYYSFSNDEGPNKSNGLKFYLAR